MTDDLVETHVILRDDEGERTVHFQEWWVRLHAAVPAAGFTVDGGGAGHACAWRAGRHRPGATCVLFPPSNPVVSIGTILAVPGIADAVARQDRGRRIPDHRRRTGPRHGRQRAWPPSACQTSAAAVGAHYGAALLDGWLVDERDKTAVDAPELAGITVRAVPLLMTDLPAAAAIAQAALDLARELNA